MTIGARVAGGLALAALTAGCGASAVTEARLERAIAGAFANLVHAQLARMRLADVPAPALRVVASCYRAAGGRAGAGDWACTIVWAGPNGATLRDSYDVSVAANACYTATLGGTVEGQLGGPTITATDGRPVRNLLYAFDGCFDPF
jgi:ABC-2 type transport system permease protein